MQTNIQPRNISPNREHTSVISVHTEIRTLNNVCKYKEVTAKQREYFTLTDSLKSYNEYLDSGLDNIIF